VKKLLLGLTTLALVFGFYTPSASALTCNISNTGPSSENNCTSIENFRCTVSNDNKVTVYNKNDQVAITGGTVTIDNTSAGSGTSGSSTNTNATVLEGTIKNNACVVTPAVVTPPVVTPPVTPPVVTPSTVTPSGGAGAIMPVAAPQTAAPSELPNTSAASTMGIVAGLVSLLGLVVAGSRLAVTAYSNIKS
jgi:hypothetical protein